MVLVRHKIIAWTWTRWRVKDWSTRSKTNPSTNFENLERCSYKVENNLVVCELRRDLRLEPMWGRYIDECMVSFNTIKYDVRKPTHESQNRNTNQIKWFHPGHAGYGIKNEKYPQFPHLIDVGSVKSLLLIPERYQKTLIALQHMLQWRDNGTGFQYKILEYHPSHCRKIDEMMHTGVLPNGTKRPDETQHCIHRLQVFLDRSLFVSSGRSTAFRPV